MKTVLVVDDKPENLAYLEALLRGHGYAVTTARHGAEALVLARQARPALIISDLLMPIMDGYTLLRHWKGDPLLRQIPFVVYTATYTEPEDEKLALDLGADAFILKPAEPDDFMTRIHEVEAIHRDPAPGAPTTAVPVPDDPVLLKAYSEALIRKLEEKSLQLEATNARLEVDLAERQAAQIALQAREREQRALAEALEGERARLAEAQALARVGSWETNLVTLEIVWSEETYRIFEMSLDTFRPTHARFMDLVHPDDRAAVNEAFVRSANDPGEHVVEHRIVTPGGREKVVLERWRALPGSDGRPERAAGTCQDITEQRHAEAVLRESEERFRQIAETITEVFWISDPTKQQMLYVSPAYRLIWGESVESLYHSPARWFEAIHPDDREEVRRAVPRQVEGRYDETYRIIRPDGQIRWVRDRAFPVRDAGGAVYRIVGVAEDVTERKEMEGRVLRAQRMESLGTLAGGIAHDLNNVLTPILMSIELLRDDPSETSRRDILSMIESSARQGAGMIRQVLSFARGVEGRRVGVDIGALIHDVERITNDTFLKSVVIEVAVEAGMPPVLGDPTQLGQVMLNLCVNARDAMPDGGRLQLAAFTRPATGSRAASAAHEVVIEVRDNGSGIPAQVIDRIFEPFFTTKPSGQGTGLGLPTSLAIVRSHEGELLVHSTPGRGSCFTIILPAAAIGADTVPDGGAPRIPGGSGELVLVVDDEPLIRAITRKMLERFGYRVVVAEDGADALAVYGAHRDTIALVLTDLMMPQMDGRALIARLRGEGVTIPIIAVSGLAGGGDDEDLVEGATGVLAKPYTAPELMHALQGALAKGG